MMDIIQLSPAERFKSLLAFASNVAIDHNVKAKFYYNSGLNMYKEFNIHYKEGNWENALSIYFKYNKLFFDKIKQHPDYGKVPVNIKSVIAANFRLIKPKAEHAKKELFEQYQMDYDCFVEEYNTNEYVSNENNSESSSAKHHQVHLNMPKPSSKKDHHDIISLAKLSAFEIRSQMSFNTSKQINDHLKLIKQAEDQQKAKTVGSNKSLTKSEIPPKKHTGSREAAFTYAISSAGVTFAITAACARGNISACGCQGQSRSREPAPDGWKWGGCSVDIDFGTRFARKFMDAREFEADERSLMNLHNNKAGRKIVKLNLLLECKCHGVSGSCTMKTCWKTLPSFRQIGDALMEKYYRARPVAAVSQQPSPRNVHTRRLKKHQHLVLTKGKMPSKKPPKKAELVFLQMSPNYCERDLTSGSLGTVGRTCNRTSRGTDGCDLMCCGRGYNTHQYVKTTQCRCKFHWCCRVECDTCSEKTEEYSCK